MSNQLVWQDRFKIGVDIIDREHKKLFSIINKLLMFKDEDGKSQWVCQEGIKYFKEHAMKHFSEEEAYMVSISYHDYETHRRLHNDFRQNTLPALEKELHRTCYSSESVGHFLSVCVGWLIGHTLTEDRAITGKPTSKWTNLLPEEEHLMIKHTIIQLVNDMFQLDSRVVSENYGGEKFGKGIYYRLRYATEKKEIWEIILVFEEKLLLSTIGKLMGDESRKMNDMVMHASRYAARQFSERIREHLPSASHYELKDENLLSYEQFQNAFEKRTPQCSLLFDTGAGYFAFCTMAPHPILKESEISIKAENAMDEVSKYIKTNDQANAEISKKKVLVVDDSDTILYAMKELLKNDYEVLTAKSGLSAIRSITLDRPDLVLLDYEMPVCDGPQVLEMIRAERDFADIPVIFLTGRMDKESVEKVIPLKPAGYLVKRRPPAEIKKNIDDYIKNHS